VERIHLKRSLIFFLGIVIAIGGISACSIPGGISGQMNNAAATTSEIIAVDNEQSFQRLMQDVSQHKVVYIGETHGRYDHHLNQLAVIEELHERGADFAIGLEFFQRPFQQYLDRYIAGEIDEKLLLKRTGSYKNWAYDFRLYRPILEYARDNGIALVALNAPSELVSRVSNKGFRGLSEEWRNQLPEVRIPADDSYKRRLQRVFDMHSHSGRQFETFLQVQLLWDEYMAESAASYLQQHPDRQLVVLAGSGHVAFGSGIPQRVQRRIPHEYTVLVSAGPESGRMDSAEHILLANDDQLPVAGKLGIYIGETGGEVTVRRLLRGHVADVVEDVLPGDLITSIAGERIRSMEDVRLAMLDRQPGEQALIELERGRTDGRQVRVATVIELI